MTSPVFRPPNRLLSVISNPNAPLFDHLVLKAQQRVATLKPELDVELSDAVDRILAYRSCSEEDLFAECLQIGSQAASIAEIAAFIGREALGKAASGLYDMVELLVERGAWHTGSVMLHLAAIHTLRSAVVEEGAAAATLEQLRQMRLLLARTDAPQ